MRNIPPEKYYEACITYNLIREFDIQFDIKLTPFSISQFEENDKGYDFGYIDLKETFLVQYKRPYFYSNSSSKLGWKIDIEQLKTLCECNIGIRAFYVLPKFISIDKWYQGLEESYFIDANELMNLLSDKLNQSSYLLSEENTSLRKWSFYFNNKTRLSNFRGVCSEYSELNKINLMDLSRKVSGKEDNKWIYVIKK